jgi:hypothetical protein
MSEDVRVRAAGFFESIREDEQPRVVERTLWKLTLFVGGLSEPDNHGVVPGQNSRGYVYRPG